MEPGEVVVHTARQSTDHLIVACVLLMVPALLVFIVGAVIPWIWFALIAYTHRGRCTVTNHRVFIQDCPGCDNNWYALWYINAVEAGGWPFNSVNIYTSDDRKLSIHHVSDPRTLAQAIRHAKAAGG